MPFGEKGINMQREPFHSANEVKKKLENRVYHEADNRYEDQEMKFPSSFGYPVEAIIDFARIARSQKCLRFPVGALADLCRDDLAGPPFMAGRFTQEKGSY